MKTDLRNTERLLVAEKLNKLYNWLEFEVKPENFDITVGRLLETLESEQRIKQFFDLASRGAFGVIQKNPTSITSMSYKFICTPHEF